MSKNIKISLGVIIALLFYIVSVRIGENSSVTEIPVLTEKIDKIQFNDNSKAVNLVSENENWIIGEKKYKGDVKKIEDLIARVNDIKVIDLISDQGYYKTYGLDEDSAFVVRLLHGEKIIRTLYIGKLSSTGKHSYIRINNEKSVYLAKDLLKTDFDLTEDDLRDKRIFTFNLESIKKFSIGNKGKRFTFIKRKIDNKSDKKGNKTHAKEASQSTELWTCREIPSVEINQLNILSILRVLSTLEAHSFIMNKAKAKGRPVIEVRVETGKGEVSLDLFKRTKDQLYPARSSESAYVFSLPAWIVEKFKLETIITVRDKK